MDIYKNRLSSTDRFIKRTFDIVFSLIGLSLTFWIIILAYLLIRLNSGESGFFRQERVGMEGKIFKVVKLRTMKVTTEESSHVTTSKDVRITPLGRILRNTKIDELPQLYNVLVGDMSFVGPRPDVAGYADKLSGDDRIILAVRPGITGPATLKYKNEEEILSLQENPDDFNRNVLYPDKVKINKEYIRNYSFLKDIGYIFKTIY